MTIFDFKDILVYLLNNYVMVINLHIKVKYESERKTSWEPLL